MNNLTVTKSIYLIDASYKLPLQAQKLVLACIAKIDSRHEIPKEITIRLFLPIPQKCKIMTLKHHSGSVGSSNEEFQNFGSAYLDAIASISITGTVSLNSNLPIKLMCCQATGEISLSLAIAA